MRTDAMILMDTKSSGRYFDARTGGVEPFRTLRELRQLCQATPRQDAPPANGTPPYCPAKGALASLRVSICYVDQAGAHGMLHLSPSKQTTFKSSDELEWLVSREAYLIQKRLQPKANGRRSAE